MKDRLTGLSRSSMNNLILPNSSNGNRPPVRSAVLRKSGAIRGIRLIHRESLLEHLESLAVDTRSLRQNSIEGRDQPPPVAKG